MLNLLSLLTVLQLSDGLTWFEGLTGLCWFLLYGLWVPPKTCKITTTTTTKKGSVSC